MQLAQQPSVDYTNTVDVDYTLVYYCTSSEPVEDLSPVQRILIRSPDVYDFSMDFTSQFSTSFFVHISMHLRVDPSSSDHLINRPVSDIKARIAQLGSNVAINVVLERIVKMKYMF